MHPARELVAMRPRAVVVSGPLQHIRRQYFFLFLISNVTWSMHLMLLFVGIDAHRFAQARQRVGPSP